MTTQLAYEDLIDIKYMDAYHGLSLASEMDGFRHSENHLLSPAGYGMLSPSSPTNIHGHPLIHSPHNYYDQEPMQYSFAMMNPPSQMYPYLIQFPEDYPRELPVQAKPDQPPRRMPSMKPKTIPCPYPGCPRVFSRQYNMRAHLEIHAPVRTKDHACPDCGRPFSRRHDMYRHQRNIHHAAKQQQPPKPATPQVGMYHSFH